MPSSVDVQINPAADYATDAPMAFRRQTNWFVSFLMMPFRDIDQRAVLEPSHQPRNGRGR